MAVDRTPILKRCRSLDMDPVVLGVNKKSRRKLTRANRKVSEYGLQLREKIEIKEKSKSLQGFKNIVEANAGVVTPAWMESDVETLTGTVKELPLREQIDVPVNDTLIVELYSK